MPADGVEGASPLASPTPPDAPRKGPLATAASALLALDLAFLALVAFLALLAAFTGSGQGEPLPAPTRHSIAVDTALSFILLGLIPIVWLLATRVRPVEGTLAYLRLVRAGPSILRGFGLGLACFAGLIALGLLLQLLGWEPENPVAEQLVRTVDWPLALFLSLAAGVGEEIFFRGLLQRWLGVLPQAALFALSHAGYGVALQVIIPGLLGLLFGILVARGASLWLVITAHFTYDFLQLALVLAVGA